jgi:hypothetical protein
MEADAARGGLDGDAVTDQVLAGVPHPQAAGPGILSAVEAVVGGAGKRD